MQFTILGKDDELLGVYLVRGADWYGPFLTEKELNAAWREIRKGG